MEEVGDATADDGEVNNWPILNVVSKHEVKPEQGRFYLIDGDGDVYGLTDEHTAGFDVLYYATAVARDIERNGGTRLSVAQVDTNKPSARGVKYQWETVWKLGDPRPKRGAKPKRPDAPGSTHTDFGSW